jgi:hypothetical protein
MEELVFVPASVEAIGELLEVEIERLNRPGFAKGIIGNRVFAFTRNVRPEDFRASGSGQIVYDRDRIHPRCIEITFKVARQVEAQSMAFDFVLDSRRDPLSVEVSYCYDAAAVYQCSGHWDSRLQWQEGQMWPQHAIVIDLLSEIRQSGS